MYSIYSDFKFLVMYLIYLQTHVPVPVVRDSVVVVVFVVVEVEGGEVCQRNRCIKCAGSFSSPIVLMHKWQNQPVEPLLKTTLTPNYKFYKSKYSLLWHLHTLDKK